MGVSVCGGGMVFVEWILIVGVDEEGWGSGNYNGWDVLCGIID